MLDFIKIYWKEILSGVCILVLFIVGLLRKKPASDILSDIFGFCIKGVNIAETEFKNGSEKLSFCVEYVLQCIKSKYPNINVKLYKDLVTVCIEQILSTPQKKGE